MCVYIFPHAYGVCVCIFPHAYGVCVCVFVSAHAYGVCVCVSPLNHMGCVCLLMPMGCVSLHAYGRVSLVRARSDTYCALLHLLFLGGQPHD